MTTGTASSLPSGQRAFLDSMGRELEAKLERVTQLIEGRHRPSEGSYREVLVRQLLRRMLPGKFRISTGFVHFGDSVSSQWDIIVWDCIEHAAFLEEGEFAIVPSAAVKGVVEVTTTVEMAKLREDLADLHPDPYWVNRGIVGATLPNERRALGRQGEVPIRAFVALRDGAAKNPGRRGLELLRDFYETTLGENLDEIVSLGAGGRWQNIVDLVVLGPGMLLEQGTFSVDGVGDCAGFRALDYAGAQRPHGAIGRFCARFAERLQSPSGVDDLDPNEPLANGVAGVILRPLERQPGRIWSAGTTVEPQRVLYRLRTTGA